MGSELVKGWSKSLRVRMCGFGDQNYSFSIFRSYQHSEVRTFVKKYSFHRPRLKYVRTHFVRGRSALHRAALNGQREEVERLVTSGAEIEATDEEGWAPQISACAVQNAKDWKTYSPNLVEECRHALAAGKMCQQSQSQP